MHKQYTLALFIFRRDLRLFDNRGLTRALACAQEVIPCFIIDPRQAGPTNAYRSMNALQFMIESLEDLDTQLQHHGSRLYLWQGKAEVVVKKLLQTLPIDAVVCNRDYTPFAIKRDNALAHVCKKSNCAFLQSTDALLTEPKEVLTATGKSFSNFTSFFRKASQLPVARPTRRFHGTFYTKKVESLSLKMLYKKIIPHPNNALHVHGGRRNGLRLLKKIDTLSTYAQERDIPARATSSLSAHIKFGTISIRELYHTIHNTLGPKTLLVQQLYWRDYYTHIAFHHPHVFKHACQRKYDNLEWVNDKKAFNAWCTGNTGFPLVDAGMRQLNQTGFMHNRVRMIVASFLTKDLHINWRLGERYFAQQLVDYDPSINNGNWQWVASTGCCAMPYFRIFNPWLQQKKFDPACMYIKKWIPELRDIPTKTIHCLFAQKTTIAGYPSPIVNHAHEIVRTKAWYRKVSKEKTLLHTR